MSSYNDDQFGFQNSLNGKKEDWVVGRKRRLDYGCEWLDLYQGKNFQRKNIVWLSKLKNGLRNSYRYIMRR